MATSGDRNGRRKPPAATQTIPTRPPVAAEPMTAAEAAPAIEAAHAAADIAAQPLAVAADLVPAPVTLPETTSNEEPAMDATIQNAAEKTAQQGQAMFADMQDRAKGAVDKSRELLAEMVEFNKGNVEAMVESSKIAASGLQTMGQDMLADAKASFDGARDAMREFAAVKSPTEFMKLQADYARSAFDTMVQQASRRTEASLKLAGEIAQPISNRVALAADKVKLAA